MRHYLRPIAYASLYFIILILAKLSFIDKKFVVPLAVIITLFILAAIIYKKEGFQKLKIFFIALLYISTAVAILFTSGIGNLPKPWNGIVAASLMTIAVILFLLTIFKLNLLTVVVEDNDEVWLK